MSKVLTDMEVELEIERLSESEAVMLARLENRINNKRRQRLYQLRWYEKRGIQLQKQGITIEDLRKKEQEMENEEEWTEQND